jgi:predicted amidohydrolase
MSVRVATCAYPVGPLADFAAYTQKQQHWVQTAVDRGAELLVFPEYASMELTSTLASQAQAQSLSDLQHELHALQALLPPLLALFSDLAAQHGVHILSPSFPEYDAADQRFYNCARLHTPDRQTSTHEKAQMTRFEAEAWGISSGQTLPVLDTNLGQLGVTICYDSEFPTLVREQIDVGAEIILVPSCTDTFAGYHRVALSCRARALENQCYILQSSTVGPLPGSLVLDENHGAAGIYGPVDRGFADDGVLASTPLDEPGWAVADLDLSALAQVREHGQVRNCRDWNLLATNPRHSPKLSLRG